MSASRPPWFAPGFQQDCTEFLKYVLDQLHEQETSYLQKTGSPGSSRASSSFRSHSKGTKALKETRKGDSQKTLIGENFGGKMTTTITCLNCQKQSSCQESFVDLPLAFPDYNATFQKALIGGSSKLAARGQSPNMDTIQQTTLSETEERLKYLHLNDLLEHYLKPEKLAGDNQYSCDKCGGLQDAERKIDITETPEYLILTLLRFSYDARLHSRSKIFREVKYPKTLVIPTSESKNHDTNERLDSLKSAVIGQLEQCCNFKLDSNGSDIYSLCSVVIHSGTSSDCGHYYCYARHSVITNTQSVLNNIKDSSADDIDFLHDKWYLFNDSNVSYASYSSFSNVTKRFTKDTAYVLIYRKVDLHNQQGHRTLDTCQPVQPSIVDAPLRGDLSAVVNKDNKMFLQVWFSPF